MKKTFKLLAILLVITMCSVSLCACGDDKKEESEVVASSSYLKETVKASDVVSGTSSYELSIKIDGNKAVEEQFANMGIDMKNLVIKLDSKIVDPSTVAAAVSVKKDDSYLEATDIVMKDGVFYFNLKKLISAISPESEEAENISAVLSMLGFKEGVDYLSFSMDDFDMLAGKGMTRAEKREFKKSMKNFSNMMELNASGEVLALQKTIYTELDSAITGSSIMGTEGDYYTLNINADNIGVLIEKLKEVCMKHKQEIIDLYGELMDITDADDNSATTSDEDFQKAIKELEEGFNKNSVAVSSKIKTSGEGASAKVEMQMSISYSVDGTNVNLGIKSMTDGSAKVEVTEPAGSVKYSELLSTLSLLSIQPVWKSVDNVKN